MPSSKYHYFKCPICKSMMWIETDDDGNIFKYYTQNGVNCDKCSSVISSILKNGVLSKKVRKYKTSNSNNVFEFPKTKI